MAELRPVATATARAPGPGRVLVLAYGFFAVAAGGRSAFQLATRFSAAPVAYLLSAMAAVIYLAGCLTIARADRNTSLTGVVERLCVLELMGVLTVGTVSVLDPGAFPDATVWSQYGAGYGLVPLALPLLGLLWARKRERSG